MGTVQDAILDMLGDREMTVGMLVDEMGVPGYQQQRYKTKVQKALFNLMKYKTIKREIKGNLFYYSRNTEGDGVKNDKAKKTKAKVMKGKAEEFVLPKEELDKMAEEILSALGGKTGNKNTISFYHPPTQDQLINDGLAVQFKLFIFWREKEVTLFVREKKKPTVKQTTVACHGTVKSASYDDGVLIMHFEYAPDVIVRC